MPGQDPNLDQHESSLVRLPGCMLKTDAYPKHTDEQLFELSPVYSNLKHESLSFEET